METIAKSKRPISEWITNSKNTMVRMEFNNIRVSESQKRISGTLMGKMFSVELEDLPSDLTRVIFSSPSNELIDQFAHEVEQEFMSQFTNQIEQALTEKNSEAAIDLEIEQEFLKQFTSEVEKSLAEQSAAVPNLSSQNPSLKTSEPIATSEPQSTQPVLSAGKKTPSPQEKRKTVAVPIGQHETVLKERIMETLFTVGLFFVASLVVLWLFSGLMGFALVLILVALIITIYSLYKTWTKEMTFEFKHVPENELTAEDWALLETYNPHEVSSIKKRIIENDNKARLRSIDAGETAYDIGGLSFRRDKNGYYYLGAFCKEVHAMYLLVDFEWTGPVYENIYTTKTSGNEKTRNRTIFDSMNTRHHTDIAHTSVTTTKAIEIQTDAYLVFYDIHTKEMLRKKIKCDSKVAEQVSDQLRFTDLGSLNR